MVRTIPEYNPEIVETDINDTTNIHNYSLTVLAWHIKVTSGKVKLVL